MSSVISLRCIQLLLFYRLLKVDPNSAAESLRALENKVPLMFRFLGDEDDDVSGAVSVFAQDYISLLKQMGQLSKTQRENIEVKPSNSATYMYLT